MWHFVSMRSHLWLFPYARERERERQKYVEAMTSQWTKRNRKKLGSWIGQLNFHKKCMQVFPGMPQDYEQDILKPLWQTV